MLDQNNERRSEGNACADAVRCAGAGGAACTPRAQTEHQYSDRLVCILLRLRLIGGTTHSATLSPRPSIAGWAAYVRAADEA